MDFTFGIVTYKESPNDIQKVIESIYEQKIPNFEIVIIGGHEPLDKNIIYYPFDDTIRAGWITKKKNLITKLANYENIVFMHDYIYLDSDWYKNFVQFGNDWSVCLNPILNGDGSRYRDWCAWDDPEFGGHTTIHEIWCPEGMEFNGRPAIVPYHYNKTKHMYISGAYFITKKSVMEKYPLNEELIWGQGEDLEWSLRIREKYYFYFNQQSKVYMTKYKDPCLRFING
jgi:glycosyltransferase involved in cell wall biosynthesis